MKSDFDEIESIFEAEVSEIKYLCSIHEVVIADVRLLTAIDSAIILTIALICIELVRWCAI